MSEPSGNVIIDGDGGKPTVSTGDSNDGGNQGRTGIGEILGGFTIESPDTERITSANGNSGGGNATGRKRGRPPGSGRKSPDPTPEKEPVHISRISLETVLYSIHLAAKEILNIEQLEIDKDEAKKLSDAFAEVSKHYAITFDPKKVALFNLASVAAGIYGPRIMAMRLESKMKRKTLGVSTPAPATPQKVNGAANPKEPDLRFSSPSSLFGQQDGSL